MLGIVNAVFSGNVLPCSAVISCPFHSINTSPSFNFTESFSITGCFVCPVLYLVLQRESSDVFYVATAQNICVKCFTSSQQIGIFASL